jgi:opacity protein-like surface antigen
MKRLALLALVLAAPSAYAQNTEVSLLAGYTTAGDIDMKAPGVQTLEVGDSFTWGLTAGHFFSDHVGFEASWSQQESALVIGNREGSADLFDMHVGLLHGSFVYRFGAPASRFTPFVLAGAGASFLSAEDIESETKFSWAVGAGLKWFPSSVAGVRVQARYAPTLLNDDDSEFCDPFGFCQGSLSQFELMGGLVLRF